MVLKSILVGGDGLPQLSPGQWCQVAVASIAYTYAVVAFAVALELTTLGSAFILSNMTSLVIIAGRFLMGLPTLKLEGYGALIGFTGAVICASDTPTTLTNDEEVTATSTNSMVLGNIISFSSSISAAIYFITAKEFRASMDLFVFMFLIMMFGCFFLFFYMILTGEVLTYDMHPDHGIFGWLNLSADRLPLEVYIALVCNLIGTVGYVAAMK